MFKAARIKLTTLYLAIITLISISFSLVTYRLLTDEVDRFARFQRIRIEERIRIAKNVPPPPDFDLITETKNRIALGLFFVNGIIIVISGGMAYLLAGKTLEPIQDMVDDQHRFVADSSHELRTPLTSLKIATEVALRDKRLSLSEAKTILNDNLLEINKLQNLSDGLLRLAQYDSQSKPIVFSRLSLKKVAQQSIVRVTGLAKNKNITIENKIKNYFINGFESDLVDLIAILLDNAIKYSPENTHINLESKKVTDFVHLYITDQGQGIAPSDLAHIFDRFFRSDKSRSGTTGYGLGLSIAKRIVDSHRGTIKVTSAVNVGSTFDVKLPSYKQN